ncbi:MAG: hypothetical protein HYU36_01950 [Planctomycetes bacterium]|nr:hypothetical protein [Planctomycetota bacterium]
MAIATGPLAGTSFEKSGLSSLKKWEVIRATYFPVIGPLGVKIITCTPLQPESAPVPLKQLEPWSNFYLVLAEEDKKLQSILRLGYSPSMPSQDSRAIEAPHIPGRLASAPEEQEILDWDAHIETPPPRPSKTIRVRFVNAGRRPPSIVEEPRD